jgi:hypothetical protein
MRLFWAVVLAVLLFAAFLAMPLIIGAMTFIAVVVIFYGLINTDKEEDD